MKMCVLPQEVSATISILWFSSSLSALWLCRLNVTFNSLFSRCYWGKNKDLSSVEEEQMDVSRDRDLLFQSESLCISVNVTSVVRISLLSAIWCNKGLKV